MKHESHHARIGFLVEEMFLHDLQKLPWSHPISEWRELGIKHFEIKRGLGRHTVVFVQAGNRKYVVKELSFESAIREVENYNEMLRRGIHTLLPVGCVTREEEPIAIATPIGLQFQLNVTGHTVTLLIERVLPDSQLYRRAFNFENRKKIWDAIVELFVELHCNGVYWGDASLANTLVKFMKEDIPHLGRKTKLKAFLADAETVEIHPSITTSLREADIEFFLESMEWLDEDLRASGIIRDEMATAMDKVYVREQYERRYLAEVKSREFEARSSLNLRKYLGPVKDAVYLSLLQTHIDEHKWYLSEHQQEEVSFSAAAQDWLDKVFLPLTELFRNEGLLELFPGKTASELYIEIMTNKYYLSQKEGKDVGMIRATRDYAHRFGTQPKSEAVWRVLTHKMLKILGRRELLLLGMAD